MKKITIKISKRNNMTNFKYTDKDLFEFAKMTFKPSAIELLKDVLPKTYVEENKKYADEKEHGYDLCIKHILFNLKKFYKIDFNKHNNK